MKENGRVLFTPAGLLMELNSETIFLSCTLPAPQSLLGLCLCFCARAVCSVVRGLPPLLLGFGKHSVTTCQVSASVLFHVPDKALGAGGEPSSQSIQKGERGGERRKRNLCHPRGKPNETESHKLSPPLRRGYRFETRHLTCAYVSSVESAEWEEENRKH